MLKNYFFSSLALLLCTMFLGQVNAQTTVSIVSPDSLAGDYAGVHAAFGPYLGGQSASLVLYTDAAGATNGCAAPANSVAGAIALIDRGTCGFAIKANNAQAAGAIAVVVCNNNTTDPDAIITMGNAPNDPLVCGLTIPAVMVSYNTCQVIKTALANGENVVAALPDEDPTEDGQSITNPIPLPGAGTYTCTELTGSFALLADATKAKFFTIQAPQTGVMNVNSCLGGVDTRVAVMQGCRNALTLIDVNDDACELTPGGDAYASSLDVVVYEGQTYVIYWDNIWDSTGFDFNVSFGDLPTVDVTFTVDMQDVTVAPEGTKISINGAEFDMTDLGGGIWSYTGSYTATDVLDYRFANGPGSLEDSPDVAACRTLTVGLAAITTPLVCFNSCSTCPPDVSCPNWVSEDFENYTLGDISPQSDIWNTWTPNSAGESAVVSNAQASGGAQSLNVTAAGGDDQLLLLGDRTSGRYILKWRMYIPTGSGAYYNIQKDEDTPGVGDAFANEVVFAVNGTGQYAIGGGSVNFNSPKDTWFDVYNAVALDTDRNTVWINDVVVTSHPASWQAGSQSGIAQLGSIDFYGFSNVSANFFVDNVLLKEVEACQANAIICDGFDGYSASNISAQSPHFTPWSLAPNGADDAVVSTEQQVSCEQSLKISAATGDDMLLLLGNRNTGNYRLSWNMYVPDGFGAYFNVQKNQNTPGSTGNFGMQVDMTADGVGTLDAGVAAAATFNYPHDAWFAVTINADLDNDIMTLNVGGTDVYTWKVSSQTFNANGLKQLGAFNFYGNTGNLYYVDDVLFEQLPAVPGNACAGAVNLSSYLGGGIGTTVSTPIFDNTNHTTTSFDPATGWQCFGEPDGAGAAPELNNTMWFSFVGDGETYFIETGDCGAANYIEDGDTQMAIYTGNCGSLSPVACNEDSPNAVAGNYISGLELQTVAGTTYYMMIDGFNLFNGAQISAGEFCVNFTQLTGSVPTVKVTFQVDMTYYLESNPLETVRIAGNFTDNGASVPNWTPPASPAFTSLGNDVWSATIEFPLTSAGQNLEYKFLNTATSWGACGVQQECMGDEDSDCKNPNNDNRLLVIPSSDATVCFTWESCLGCNVVGVEDQLVEVPMTVAPNPFSNRTVVTFHTEVNGQVRLTNAVGQLVKSYRVNGEQLVIERDGMTPGIYFLNVITKEGTSVAQKLVVE